MDYQTHVQQTIDRYKCKSKNDYLVCLPVFDSDDNEIAYLRPITANYAITIPNCVELMSKWRIENPSLATGTFTVTHERTKKWLDNIIIANNRKILFLISDFCGNYLGHIGFAAFDFENCAAEVDSVLRGVKGTIPGLMQFCMQSLIHWGKKNLLLKNISLEVFSDNIHAVEFYHRCGFEDDYLIPMIKVILPDEEKWEPSPDPNLPNAERYFLKMRYIG